MKLKLRDNTGTFVEVTAGMVGAIPSPSDEGTTGQILKKTSSGVEWDDNASGVSSWNDLTDKPFYSEANMPLTNVIFDSTIGVSDWEAVPQMNVFTWVSPTNITIPNGITTVTLTINNVDYHCGIGSANNMTYIGNGALWTGCPDTCTDEGVTTPIFIMCNTEPCGVIYGTTESEAPQMHITISSNTVGTLYHKLDSNYIDSDNTPTSGSTKPVTSGGVYTALQGVQVTTTNTVEQNNSYPVTSGGVYTALQDVQVTTTDTIASGNTNPVSSNGVYTALQQIREVPAVTTSDNNKILMVVNGVWTPVTINDDTGVY